MESDYTSSGIGRAGEKLQKADSVDTGSTSMVSMIERLALRPEVDVQKLERLLDMQERILKQQGESAFNRAMTAAQSEMGRISADATNPQTRSQYASYAQLDRYIRPVYTRHGFSLSFDESDSPKPDHVRVLCHVSHIAGHRRTYQKDLPADGKGAKGGDVMTKTHAAGAATTYGMRYLLKMIFNVAIGEDDDDGNGAEPVERITASQAADLKALAEEVQADEEKFLGYLAKLGKVSISSFSEIPAKMHSEAVAQLERRRAKAKP